MFGRLPNRHGRLAALDCRVMDDLGSFFSTGRLDFLILFLLLFLTRAGIFFILLAIRFPLLLTFTPLPSSSSVCSCAPLGIEYILVVTWKTTNKTKVSRLNCSKTE